MDTATRRGTPTRNGPAVASRRGGIERALLWLEALLAVGAYGGAAGLLTGAIDLGASTADLPLASPVLAGLALGLAVGVLPTVVLLGALARRPWAGPGHVVVGAVLAGWIVVQVGFIGLGSWLQVGYFAYGLAVAGLGWRLLRASPSHPGA